MKPELSARKKGDLLVHLGVMSAGDELHVVRHEEVQVPVDGVVLGAELTVPRAATGVVLFAHGSGSGRHSPRNQYVAWNLQCAGLGTLHFDLLTREEELDDTLDSHLRFDVRTLARRLIAATAWSATHESTRNLNVGYLGAGTVAAAELIAASQLGRVIAAIVLRAGRPDLASAELVRVVSPTLFIVAGHNELVLEVNRNACATLSCEARLEVVPTASEDFEEPRAVNAMAALAAEWFRRHLGPNYSTSNSPVA